MGRNKKRNKNRKKRGRKTVQIRINDPTLLIKVTFVGRERKLISKKKKNEKIGDENLYTVVSNEKKSKVF